MKKEKKEKKEREDEKEDIYTYLYIKKESILSLHRATLLKKVKTQARKGNLKRLL